MDKSRRAILCKKIAEIAASLDTTPEYLMGRTLEVSKRVNKDEMKLVNGYRNLSDEGKRLVKDMIGQLISVVFNQ